MPKARMRPQATRLSFWPGLSLFTRPPLQQCHFLGLPPTSSHLCSTLLLPPFPKHHTPDVLKTMLHECALAVHESLPAPALVGMSDSVAARLGNEVLWKGLQRLHGLGVSGKKTV